MRHAVALLLLFLMYQTAVVAFTHVHYVDGIPIAHSHPFGGHHQHNTGSLILLCQLAHFMTDAVEQPVWEVPLRRVLCTFRALPLCAKAPGRMTGVHLLRAPPRG